MAEGEQKNLAGVKNIILVLSGKGGVGKSTVATQLSLSLKALGKKVGLLDIDLCGPSVPRMLNLTGKDVHNCSQGWVPVYTDASQQLGVMSIGFLLEKQDDPVVWRGPKKNAMIKQFVEDVYWQQLDYLVVDTPPGTSDEHISVVEQIKQFKNVAAVLVTTPQAVSVNDVRRELTFCKKTGLSVFGIIENMSGFVCPHCDTCTNLFSKGGGLALAEQYGVPYLGAIPLDPNLSQCGEEGKSFIEQFQVSPARTAVICVVEKIVQMSTVESFVN